MNPHSVLLDNIGQLVTNEPQGRSLAGADDEAALGIRRSAAVALEGGLVRWIGRAGAGPPCDLHVDCRAGAVLPGFVDSHAHLVFAGDRAGEFVDRMSGRPSTAGILQTVDETRRASDAVLRATCGRLVGELVRSGTTTFEVKSGYGLTVADEARSCRIASELTREVTYLGAHVVPAEAAADRDAHVQLVAGPMLAACAPHARWADVFCDRGAFDVDEARTVLTAARRAALGLRVHANQHEHGPGVALAVEMGAASADHCTYLSDADVAALADSGTVATLLPAAEFGTRAPYPDARRLLRAGASVALATDCNPGTSYTTSMSFVMALAVRELGMTPAEALTAATLGGARALRRDDVGRIRVGGPADVVLLDAPSYVHLAYRPGVDLISQVWRVGRAVRSGPDGR